MAYTIVTLTKDDEIISRLYDCGTQSVKDQLTDMGVAWEDGHKRYGVFKGYVICITAVSAIKRRVKDFPYP